MGKLEEIRLKVAKLQIETKELKRMNQIATTLKDSAR